MEAETKRVLAAPGKRVIFATKRGVRRQIVGGPDGARLSCAVWIGEDGLYTSRDPSTPSVHGPVAVPWDARHKRLVADGDLILVADELKSTRSPKPRADKE